MLKTSYQVNPNIIQAKTIFVEDRFEDITDTAVRLGFYTYRLAVW